MPDTVHTFIRPGGFATPKGYLVELTSDQEQWELVCRACVEDAHMPVRSVGAIVWPGESSFTCYNCKAKVNR